MNDPIEVVKHGFLYRATTVMDVHRGSPYRSIFMSGMSIVVAWGFSYEQAAARCRAKRAKRHQMDEKVWSDKRSKTRVFS